MKLTLKSRLISKYSCCTFWIQPWFQKTSENFHLLTCEKISHPLISHLLLPKCPWANVWISSSPMILLSSLSERANFFYSEWRFHVCGLLWYIIFYFLMKSWCTLICSSEKSVNLIDGLSIKLAQQCQFDLQLVIILTKQCQFER